MDAGRAPTTEKHVYLYIRKENQQRKWEGWAKKSEKNQERTVSQRPREEKWQDQVIQAQTSV